MRFLKPVLAFAILAAAAAARAEDVNSSLKGSCKFIEFIVTNAAGGSTLTVLPGRRAVELVNGGANTIYCRLDGTAPTASTAGGRPVVVGIPWTIDAADVIVVKCIAATAAQVTTAATAVHQCK